MQDAWCDQYAPQHLDDLIGNVAVVRALRAFIDAFDASSRSSPRAVLLHGPIGSGKSAALSVIVRSCGRRLVSWTDTECEVTQSYGLSTYWGTKRKRRPIVVVVDHVDALAERGAVARLTQTIQRTQVPMVCLAQDGFARQLQTLKRSCLVLRWRPATPAQFYQQVASICQAEDVAAPPRSILLRLAHQCAGDLRYMIHQVQWAFTTTAAATLSTKDTPLCSTFDRTRQWLAACPRLDWNARCAELSSDPDHLPLMVHENYASALSERQLETMVQVSEDMSTADLLYRGRFEGDEWMTGLHGICSAIAPAARVAAVVQPTPSWQALRFPGLLGQQASRTQQTHRLQSFQAHSWPVTQVDSASARLDYLCGLLHHVTVPLQRHGNDAIQAAVQDLAAYGVVQLALEGMLQWNVGLAGDRLPRAVQTALTRALHDWLYPSPPKAKGKRKLSSGGHSAPKLVKQRRNP